MIQFDLVTASVRKTWPARCTATMQTHKALLKTTFSLIERRKLSKTKLRHGALSRGMWTFQTRKQWFYALLLSLLHSFARKSRHAAECMARTCGFSLQESSMCNKLVSHAQAREARELAQSKVLLSYYEKTDFHHRRASACHR